MWVPPGSSKSTVVSIMWPAWEWAREPWLRYITASYDHDLATEFATKSRDLIKSGWYQARWPHVQIHRDQDLKQSYANTAGGTGTRRARRRRYRPPRPRDHHRQPAQREGGRVGGGARGGPRVARRDDLDAVRGAEDRRGGDHPAAPRRARPRRPCARPRPGGWEVSVLPEEYEPAHPFAWRGDPRAEPGELLMPDRVGPGEHAARLRDARRASRRRPTPTATRRAGGRDPASAPAGGSSRAVGSRTGAVGSLPRFSALVQSWDTSFKDPVTPTTSPAASGARPAPDLYLLARGTSGWAVGDEGRDARDDRPRGAPLAAACRCGS